MSSGRDENSNPNRDNPEKSTQKTGDTSKPLTPSNEEVDTTTPKPKKKKTRTEQRRERNFRLSGMPQGALLKYLATKKDPEQSTQVSSAGTEGPKKVSSTYMEGILTNLEQIKSEPEPTTFTVNEDGGEDAVTSSQDSDITTIYCGPKKKSIEVVDLTLSPQRVTSSSVSDDEDDFISVNVPLESNNENDKENSEPEIESEPHLDVIEPPHSPSTERRYQDVEDSLVETDNAVLGSTEINERIAQMQANTLKRRAEDVDPSESQSQLRPPKTPRPTIPIYNETNDIEFEPEDFPLPETSEATPERQTSSSWTSSPIPPWKIVCVRGADGTSGSSSSPSSSNMNISVGNTSIDRVRSTLLVFKERDNEKVCKFMKKRDWRKAIDEMQADLLKFRLPKQTYVSKLIDEGILCNNTRGNKRGQMDCMQFLEGLFQEYSSSSCPKDRRNLINYFKGVLENVFDEAKGKLYNFLKRLMQQVTTDSYSQQISNSLWLLNQITKLVVNEYKDYDKQNSKLKPSFFQQFFEIEVGIFKIESCEGLISKFFLTKHYDEFLIYMKWIELLSRRLSFTMWRTEYASLVQDFVNHCKGRDDLGLFIFMNCDNVKFASDICWKILDDSLQVSRIRDEQFFSEAEEDAPVSKEEKIEYLTNLANSLLIRPAESIILSVKKVSCDLDNSLEYKLLRLDCHQEELEKLIQARDKSSSRYGDSQLHLACKKEGVFHFKEAFEKHPEKINARDNFGNTPLHDCFKENRGDIIVYLMEYYFKQNHNGNNSAEDVDFLSRNQNLETPLHLAALYCDASTIQMLKAFLFKVCGLTQEVLLTPNGEGKLPFELAVDTTVRRELKPDGYNEDEFYLFDNLAMSPISKNKLQTSFALKKILAWWGISQRPDSGESST